MKAKPENPNDHKKITPATKGQEGNGQKFTSYDTSKKETSTPQKVREARESPAEQDRSKNAKGKS